MFRAADAKGPTGNRYESEYILECLLLNIKSQSAYNHLRSSKLLPLPDPNHLRRLMRGVSCKFGLHEFALDAIEKDLKDKNEDERSGIL